MSSNETTATPIQVGTLKVQDRTLDVFVNPDRWWVFWVTVDAKQIASQERDKLATLASQEVSRRKIQLSIEVVMVNPEKDGPAYVRATLRGRHARTREYLFTVDGKPARLDYPHIVALGSDMPDEGLAELNRLAAETKRAQQAQGEMVDQYRRKRSLFPETLIQEAEKAAGIIQ
jgi:hypothetical protein